jgi:hypothetical protein
MALAYSLALHETVRTLALEGLSTESQAPPCEPHSHPCQGPAIYKELSHLQSECPVQLIHQFTHPSGLIKVPLALGSHPQLVTLLDAVLDTPQPQHCSSCLMRHSYL